MLCQNGRDMGEVCAGARLPGKVVWTLLNGFLQHRGPQGEGKIHSLNDRALKQLELQPHVDCLFSRRVTYSSQMPNCGEDFGVGSGDG
jgi:hypothetical protein